MIKRIHLSSESFILLYLVLWVVLGILLYFFGEELSGNPFMILLLGYWIFTAYLLGFRLGRNYGLYVIPDIINLIITALLLTAPTGWICTECHTIVFFPNHGFNDPIVTSLSPTLRIPIIILIEVLLVTILAAFYRIGILVSRR